MRFIACILVWVFLSAALPAKAALDIEKFETFVAELADSDDIVGLAIAVVHDGDIILMQTYGQRAINVSEPIDDNTRFRIASLSKAFAATTVAQLVEEGKLSLDVPASTFAPQFRLKDTRQLPAATLENILSHRVGLPPYAYDNLLEAGVAPDTILQRLGDVDMTCRVGQCYGYQNVTFNIAASAVEAADERPYAQAVETRLFDPLGLTDASFGEARLKVDDNWARSHRRRRGQGWRLADVREPYYGIPAAGGINASISDMGKWLAAQMGGAPEIINEDIRALLFEPRVRTPAELRRNRRAKHLKNAHYGLGWRIYDYAGNTVINHSGSVEGYSAQIAFLPEDNIGFILLGNSRSGKFWEVLPAFLDMQLGLFQESKTSAGDD